MADTRVDVMPTMPPSLAVDLPAGVDGRSVLWDEIVAGQGYTAVVLPRGGCLRIVDREGDGCAGLLLHHRGQPTERLNVADTMKVQWRAYLGLGTLLLSDLGRVMATVVEDSSGRHDALCGTSTRARNRSRYGDGSIDGTAPSGRDLFALALMKHGLTPRDVAPNINLFKGVQVGPDGSLAFDGDPRPGAAVVLRAELPLLVSLVSVSHPLDPRPHPVGSRLRVTAWAGPTTPLDDPWRTATPEGERAFLNSEQAMLSR